MKYIYESPDGGKTVYQIPFGSDVRQLIKSPENSIPSTETIITDDGNTIVIINLT